MRYAIRAGLGALLVWGLVGSALAQGLGYAEPDEVGFSKSRLGDITETLKADVDHGVIPGATLLIARHGKIAYFETVGWRNPGSKVAMSDDTIFRLFSMSKPITTVAAMILVERGKLSIGDPVAKYIPDFAHLQVLVANKDPNDQGKDHLVPAKRGPTVQDLMRHTSGLTYGFWSDPVAPMYAKAGLFGGDYDNAEFARRIAQLPLAFQPGTVWNYSNSTDVLGRVVEVASGKSLYQFEKENILDPLGMTDTTFSVPAANKGRVAEGLPSDNSVFGFPLFDPTLPAKFEAGGQGMEGTTMDYARFLQMLLNGGELDGHRILSPETVALMTHDHLGRIGPSTNIYLPGPGYGFGLGFAVRRAEGQAYLPGSVGDYFWGGAAGTAFWNDPKQQILVVFMVQAPKQGPHYQATLRNMIYAALTDPEK